MTITSISTKVPVLETKRTIMRRHSLDDFEAMVGMWADEQVFKHISGKPSSKQETWFRLLRYLGFWEALGFGYWAVTEKDTGIFLGEVGFADFKRDLPHELEGLPEIGWVFTSPSHRKGFATEAVTAAIDWADRNLQSNKTFCVFDPEHAASIKVGTKTGYGDAMTVPFGDESALVMQRNNPNFQKTNGGSSTI